MYGLLVVIAMKRLAVIVPFYKRKEVTKLCLKRLEEQQKKFGFDVFTCGDMPTQFNDVICNNLPLGNKNNTLLEAARGYESVMIVGSDNFISDSIFEVYSKVDLTQKVYYGFDNVHFYSAWHNKLGSNVDYTKNGNTVGVARLWTRPTLEAMDYKLWARNLNSGLDSDSKRNMERKKIKEVHLPYDEHFILDVKVDNNITNPAIVNTCDEYYDIALLEEILGPIAKEILALKPGTKTINNPKYELNALVKVEFIVEAAGMPVGTIREVPYKRAQSFIERGLAIYYDEPKMINFATKIFKMLTG